MVTCCIKTLSYKYILRSKHVFPHLLFLSSLLIPPISFSSSQTVSVLGEYLHWLIVFIGFSQVEPLWWRLFQAERRGSKNVWYSKASHLQKNPQPLNQHQQAGHHCSNAWACGPCFTLKPATTLFQRKGFLGMGLWVIAWALVPVQVVRKLGLPNWKYAAATCFHHHEATYYHAFQSQWTVTPETLGQNESFSLTTCFHHHGD